MKILLPDSCMWLCKVNSKILQHESTQGFPTFRRLQWNSLVQEEIHTHILAFHFAPSLKHNLSSLYNLLLSLNSSTSAARTHAKRDPEKNALTSNNAPMLTRTVVEKGLVWHAYTSISLDVQISGLGRERGPMHEAPAIAGSGKDQMYIALTHDL